MGFHNMFSWRNKKNIMWVPILSGAVYFSDTKKIHCHKGN